jgi:Fic family protein
MVLVWEPIADLPENWRYLSDGELGPLLQFWNDQRLDLEQSGALAAFNQRLGREWSIETGQIEGVYNLDRGITQTLIERGIRSDLIPAESNQKPPELIAAIIQDHYHVLEGLFQFVKGERSLTKGYIHELHAALLAHQDTTVVMDQFGKLFEARLQKGIYKQRPNNPMRPDGVIHQYSPPEQVDPEMERLLQMHLQHVVHGVPIEVEAAWLHHRFAQIHPYQDGNGRVARSLASLVFNRGGWFPVVVTRDDRARYIDALEVADEGDLRSLVSFFVDVQKRALFQATQAAADVHEVHSVAEAIWSAKRVLVGVGKTWDPGIWASTTQAADRLMEIAGKRIQEIAHTLTQEIGSARSDLAFLTGTGISLPLPLSFTANSEAYESNCILYLKGSRAQRIEVQAKAIGSKFRGLIGVVVGFNSGRALEGEIASLEAFQINYAESYESAERRFRPWLETSLVNALTMWRKSL